MFSSIVRRARRQLFGRWHQGLPVPTWRRLRTRPALSHATATETAATSMGNPTHSARLSRAGFVQR